MKYDLGNSLCHFCVDRNFFFMLYPSNIGCMQVEQSVCLDILSYKVRESSKLSDSNINDNNTNYDIDSKATTQL